MRRTIELQNYGGHAAAGRVEQALIAAALPKAPPMEMAGGAVETIAKTCPKCGRELGRGAHFHIKACKG